MLRLFHAEEISRVNDSQTAIHMKSPGQKATGAKLGLGENGGIPEYCPRRLFQAEGVAAVN